MAGPAKTFDYATAVDRTGAVSVEGGAAAEVPSAWKPEHLVLAGLIRCTLASLRYHAQRSGLDDLVASGNAEARVTKREEDERYAFVDVECALEVELDPVPPPDELAELLAKAERDCFVGASLTSSPRYRWAVNGRPA